MIGFPEKILSFQNSPLGFGNDQQLAIQQSGIDEEERRLFFVAVTRAKQALYLSNYYR